MSTFSRSATSAALRSGRTLKPMTMAFDADASSTSDSLMAPTPRVDDADLDLARRSASCSVSASTSAEPCTSALMMIGSSFMPPSAICCCSDSSVRRPPLAPSAFSLACAWRKMRNLPRLGRRRPAPGTRRRAAAGRRGRALRPASTGRRVFDLAGRDRRSARGPCRRSVPAMNVSPTLQRAVLHEDRRHRAAAAIELRFEHGARRVALRVGLAARGCR